MKFYEKLIYNIKRIVPMAGLAGATMLPVSCCKPDIHEEIIIDEPPIKKHNVDVVFNSLNFNKVLLVDSLQKYVDDKSVDTIYLVPTQHWNGSRSTTITNLRKNFLQPCIELSPKMRGRGDFDFHLGSASWVPMDSLWYTQQGWTINKDYQR